MSNLADSLGGNLARVVTSVLDKFGSLVTIVRRNPDAVRADNSAVEQWVPLAAGSDVRMLLYNMTARRLTYVWGSLEGAEVEGVVSSAVGDLKVQDGIEVTEGAFSGQRFRVLLVRPEPRGGLVQLALARVQQEFPR